MRITHRLSLIAGLCMGLLGCNLGSKPHFDETMYFQCDLKYAKEAHTAILFPGGTLEIYDIFGDTIDTLQYQRLSKRSIETSNGTTLYYANDSLQIEDALCEKIDAETHTLRKDGIVPYRLKLFNHAQYTNTQSQVSIHLFDPQLINHDNTLTLHGEDHIFQWDYVYGYVYKIFLPDLNETYYLEALISSAKLYSDDFDLLYELIYVSP